MSARGWELVATDKSAILAKSSFDPIVTKDGQDGGGFTDSSSADQGDWRETFRKANDPVNQLFPPKEDPRRRRRKFPRYAGSRCQTADPRQPKSYTYSEPR